MNNDNNFLRKNGFSIAICSFIAIAIVASIYVSYNNFNDNKTAEIENETIIEQVNKSNVKSYKETETITEATTIYTTEKIETTTKKVETTTEATTQQESNISSNKDDDKIFSLFDDSKEMSWPVFGNIVSNFDITTGVYDKTLEQYKISDSICISSPAGTDVKASAEGIVENIFIDDELGQTVVINHGNGWVSTYSQLEEDVLVAVGDIVKEGEVLCKVSEPTKYGVALGPHLDFKILKDDTPQNPTEFLAQINE